LILIGGLRSLLRGGKPFHSKGIGLQANLPCLPGETDKTRSGLVPQEFTLRQQNALGGNGFPQLGSLVSGKGITFPYIGPEFLFPPVGNGSKSGAPWGLSHGHVANNHTWGARSSSAPSGPSSRGVVAFRFFHPPFLGRAKKIGGSQHHRSEQYTPLHKGEKCTPLPGGNTPPLLAGQYLTRRGSPPPFTK